jgi:hypothetical protein
MSCDQRLQLQLGAPLFLFALIIVNARYLSSMRRIRHPPPDVQSVACFTKFRECDRVAKARKRVARAAIKVAALKFIDSGVRAPAGLCVEADPPPRLERLATWLESLSLMAPSEALTLLADSADIVPENVYRAVEDEYNAGIRAAAQRLPDLARLQLEPGHLVLLITDLKYRVSSIPPAVPALDAEGTFYYVDALHDIGPISAPDRYPPVVELKPKVCSAIRTALL